MSILKYNNDLKKKKLILVYRFPFVRPKIDDPSLLYAKKYITLKAI